jgi:hypothetical protein
MGFIDGSRRASRRRSRLEGEHATAAFVHRELEMLAYSAPRRHEFRGSQHLFCRALFTGIAHEREARRPRKRGDLDASTIETPFRP